MNSLYIDYRDVKLGLEKEKNGFWNKASDAGAIDARHRDKLRFLLEGGGRCGCLVMTVTMMNTRLHLINFT